MTRIEFGIPAPTNLERGVTLSFARPRAFGPEWYADNELETINGAAVRDSLRPEEVPVPWWAVESNFPSDDLPGVTSRLMMNNPFRFTGDLEPGRYLAEVMGRVEPNGLVVGALLSLCGRIYKKTTFGYMIYPPEDDVRDRYRQYFGDVKKVLESYRAV